MKDKLHVVITGILTFGLWFFLFKVTVAVYPEYAGMAIILVFPSFFACYCLTDMVLTKIYKRSDTTPSPSVKEEGK